MPKLYVDEEKRPKIWWRYLDDIIAVCQHNINDIHILLDW